MKLSMKSISILLSRGLIVSNNTDVQMHYVRKNAISMHSRLFPIEQVMWDSTEYPI